MQKLRNWWFPLTFLSSNTRVTTWANVIENLMTQFVCQNWLCRKQFGSWDSPKIIHLECEVKFMNKYIIHEIFGIGTLQHEDLFTPSSSLFFRFDWNISLTELSERVLDVMVKNSVGIFSNSVTRMGRVEIDFQNFDFSTPVTEWYVFESFCLS